MAWILLRQRMRGSPSPASLWWCTAGSAAPLETPPVASFPRRINFLAKRRRRRRRARRVRDCDRAEPRLRLERRWMCFRVGCTYVQKTATRAHTRTRRRTHPRRRHDVGANVRIRASKIWSTDRFRTTPSRLRSYPLTPPRRPSNVIPLSVYTCIYAHIRRMNALLVTAAGLSQCIPFLLFQEMRLSIFYQIVYLDARLSVCSSDTLFRIAVLYLGVYSQ